MALIKAKQKRPMLPEFEALTRLARPQRDPAALARLEILWQSGLDWERFSRLARIHKLAPLIYSRLQQNDYVKLPERVESQFSQAYGANAAQTTRLLLELLQVVEALGAAGIETLVIKGPVLAQLAYDSLTVRQFSDLDLVVRPEEVTEASRLLQERGYRPQFELKGWQLATYRRQHYELAFARPQSNLAIDLHWSLLAPRLSFAPDTNLLWDKSAEIELAGTEVKTLGREELLLYLCAHAAKDNWSSLGAICDIAGLVERSPGLDWERLRRMSGQIGSYRMYYAGLRLAEELLGLQLPPTTVTGLQPRSDREKLVSRIIEWLSYPAQSQWEWFVTSNLYLASMDKQRDRLQYWLDEVFTPTPYEWQQVALPPQLIFLYYPLRLWNFSRKYMFHKPG